MIEINATMLAQILNFLILAIILRALAYKPVSRLLKQRSDNIKNSIDKAEADKRAAADSLKSSQLREIESHKTAQKIIANAESEARVARDKIIADTKIDCDKIRAAAKADIESDRLRAFDSLRSEIISISIAAAEQIIQKNLSAKDNDKIISDFIQSLDKSHFSEV